MSSLGLGAFQAWFANALVRDGASDAPAKSSHLSMIAAGGALGPSARMRIYQEAFWIRMNENLEEDYPGVRRLLGDDEWRALVREFITESPQAHPSLIHLGAALPAYLGAHRADRPELAAVARVEWAKIEVRHAEISTSAITALPTLPPEALFGIRLVPSRGARRLELPCRAGRWLSALGYASAKPPPIEDGAETVVVVRQGFEVRVDPVPPAFAGVLAALMAGARLADAVESLDPAETSPAEVTQAFTDFLSRGYFERFEL